MTVRLASGSFLGRSNGSESLDGVLLREIRHDPGDQLPVHFHVLPYFCFVHAGSLRERCSSTENLCQSGAAIFNPPFLEHSDTISQKGARCVVAELSTQWTSSYFDGVAQGAWRTLGSPTASWVGSRLLAEMERPDSASSIAVTGLVLTMIAELNRAPAIRNRAPHWLRSAANRLRDEWAYPPPIASLAEAAGIHPVYFARVFRKEFQCTPGEFVRRRRIEWARDQLSSGTRSISEIAHAAGFADQSHLVRTFKRHTGLTPSAYRANSRR